MKVWDSNFFDKNSPFLPGCTFKLAGKNWIEGDPEPLVFHIVVSYYCKWKMLKKTETEETVGFFGTFFHWWNFNWGEAGSLVPPLWLRLCSNWGKQKRCSQIFREVSGVFQQNFNGSKNSAVLELRTWQFSRTWGFEAKAKDFKMCRRGQVRPRGHRLWLRIRLALQQENHAKLG